MMNILHAKAIGSIMFSMITTRSNLAYAINFFSRFMSNLGKPHQAGLKWLLRYIAGTLNTGLTFEKRYENLTLVGYVDSNFNSDEDQRKSTTAFFFYIEWNFIT